MREKNNKNGGGSNLTKKKKKEINQSHVKNRFRSVAQTQ